MTSFTDLVQQGAASAWLFLPTAFLLGALHGLEPGHSKTMMAAFIIAVRGTIPQAVLLGFSAMVSHTAIIWVLALAAITWGGDLVGEDSEPVFMLVSGVIVVVLAAWMFVQTRRVQVAANEHHDPHGAHHHGHDHDHHHHGHDHRHHDHRAEPADPHARFHAHQIEERFSGRQVTTGQVVMFGLTGGLLPCSAAVAVLLLCLQIEAYTLGVALVGAFSLGLAATLIAVGVLAAWGVQKASRRWSGVQGFLARLPYLSSALVFAIGVAMAVNGWIHLGTPHT